MMVKMSMTILLLAITCLIGYSVSDNPTITLSHGGQLNGLRTTFQNTTVDLFLGVRYAQPPTGQLRFKRPEPVQSWTGEVDAKKPGNKCMQPGLLGTTGSEDCLFLDITVPGGVETGAKKPVMVWIHGGGFFTGTGTPYVGAVLAVTGDVVIVTINYRLGILGFLIDSEGSGNFGLWDQRAALVWVKENIEQFGGDPDRITIFGQSAGGGAVSCQTIGQQNDGVFQRAIAMSGSCLTALPQSENKRYMLEKAIRERTNCKADVSIYDCFKHMTGEEVLEVPIYDIGFFMMPYEDGDFFAKDTMKNGSFQLSQRYDYMGGYNSLDGGLFYATGVVPFALQAFNRSEEEGVDMEIAKGYLSSQCSLSQFTPLSVEMCVDFIVRTYELDKAADDKERAIRLTKFLGENGFGTDITNQLEQHDASEKSTYSYYYTQPSVLGGPAWSLPSWMRTTADHGDELGPLFGAPFLKDELEQNPTWRDLIATDKDVGKILNANLTYSTEEKDFSLYLMTAWTNFARSGNPNSPGTLPNDSSMWPAFNTQTNLAMEISEQQNKVVTTPYRERLAKLREVLGADSKKQRLADKIQKRC